MADMEANTQDSAESKNIVYLWKIPIDQDFVKSYPSILRVVAAFLSLIAFICVAAGRSEGCDDDYAGAYNYFEFVSITSFLTLIIMWLFFAVTLHTKLMFKLVPWTFGYLIGTAFLIILYVFANIILAAQSCGKGGNAAGAVFGFIVMLCLIVDAFFLFREWRSSRSASANNSATASKSPDYNPDRNMEQY